MYFEVTFSCLKQTRRDWTTGSTASIAVRCANGASSLKGGKAAHLQSANKTTRVALEEVGGARAVSKHRQADQVE